MADTWCTLCGEARGDTPPAGWWEVKALGLERRVHEVCFREAMGELRETPLEELLGMVREAETEKGIER